MGEVPREEEAANNAARNGRTELHGPLTATPATRLRSFTTGNCLDFPRCSSCLPGSSPKCLINLVFVPDRSPLGRPARTSLDESESNRWEIHNKASSVPEFLSFSVCPSTTLRVMKRDELQNFPTNNSFLGLRASNRVGYLKVLMRLFSLSVFAIRQRSVLEPSYHSETYKLEKKIFFFLKPYQSNRNTANNHVINCLIDRNPR